MTSDEVKKRVLIFTGHLIDAAERMFDVAGHYARPDVFNFSVSE